MEILQCITYFRVSLVRRKQLLYGFRHALDPNSEWTAAEDGSKLGFGWVSQKFRQSQEVEYADILNAI